MRTRFLRSLRTRLFFAVFLFSIFSFFNPLYPISYILYSAPSTHAAWSPPSSNFPAGNPAAPLDTGTSEQKKDAPLFLKGGLLLDKSSDPNTPGTFLFLGNKQKIAAYSGSWGIQSTLELADSFNRTVIYNSDQPFVVNTQGIVLPKISNFSTWIGTGGSGYGAASGMLIYDTQAKITKLKIDDALPGTWITANSQWSDVTGGGIFYASGNVGIGIASPQGQLDVGDKTNPVADACTGGYTWVDYNGNAVKDTGECWRGIIVKDGNIGIGTTVPAGLLHIKAGANDALAVTTDGNVGIGAINPSEKIEIANGNLFLSSPGGSPDLIFGTTVKDSYGGWFNPVVEKPPTTTDTCNEDIEAQYQCVVSESKNCTDIAPGTKPDGTAAYFSRTVNCVQDTATYRLNNQGGNLQFISTEGTKVVLNQGGLVGIGVTTPRANLEVAESAIFGKSISAGTGLPPVSGVAIDANGGWLRASGARLNTLVVDDTLSGKDLIMSGNSIIEGVGTVGTSDAKGAKFRVAGDVRIGDHFALKEERKTGKIYFVCSLGAQGTDLNAPLVNGVKGYDGIVFETGRGEYCVLMGNRDFASFDEWRGVFGCGWPGSGPSPFSQNQIKTMLKTVGLISESVGYLGAYAENSTVSKYDFNFCDKSGNDGSRGNIDVTWTEGRTSFEP